MRKLQQQRWVRRLTVLAVGVLASSFGLAVGIPAAANASQVSAVNVSVNASQAGITAAIWTITFTPNVSLTPTDTVTVNFPTGIDASNAGVYGASQLGCGAAPGSTASASSVTVSLLGCSGFTADGSTPASFTLTGIKPTAGDYPQSSFSVATSQETPATAGTGASDVVIMNSYAADGSGTVTVSPASVIATSTGQTFTFAYVAATGGMSSGEVDITVPTGWSFPSAGNVPGCSTASTGTLAVVSGQTIQVTGVTLVGGGTLTVTYGATTGGLCQVGDGVTVPATTGSATFTTTEMSTGSGTLTALSSSPAVNITAAAADGSGTVAVSPASVTTSSTGNTLTFTYTAAAGGTANGEVDLTVPSGWSAPSTSSGPGCTTEAGGGASLAVAGRTIQVTSLSLAGGGTATITYGATAGGICGAGDGVSAPSTSGSSTFTTTEKSTAGGTLSALASSPQVSVNAPAPAGGNSSSAAPPVKLVITSAPLSVAPSTSATNAITVTLEDASGNAVPNRGGPISVQLSASGALYAPETGALYALADGPIFASALGAAPFSPPIAVVIDPGTSSVTVYFGDSIPGPVTITASTLLLASATQTETILAPGSIVPTITVSTSRASVPVTGVVTITAVATTTTSGGTALADSGAILAFSVSGPDAGSPHNVATDNNGRAMYSFRNNGSSGTDVVSVSLPGSSASASTSVDFTPVAPGRPTITATTPGDAQVTVYFKAPPTDGGAPITSYLVTAKDMTNPGPITTSAASKSPITVSGLVNGDHYALTVHASNRAGPGAESKQATAVPQACAGYKGNGAFVCALYEDFLGRQPGAAGLTKWGAQLGGGASRVAVAAGILASTEYRTDLVNSFYEELLHRAAGSAGLSFFTSELNSGQGDQYVLAQIVTSKEFFAHASAAAPACRALTGNDAFVCALYEDLLGRAPDAADRDYYATLLTKRNGSPDVVALDFLQSQEYRYDLVTADYQKLLGRTPGQSELAYWAGTLQHNSNEMVLEGLAGSPEFSAHVAN